MTPCPTGSVPRSLRPRPPLPTAPGSSPPSVRMKVCCALWPRSISMQATWQPIWMAAYAAAKNTPGVPNASGAAAPITKVPNMAAMINSCISGAAGQHLRCRRYTGPDPLQREQQHQRLEGLVPAQTLRQRRRELYEHEHVHQVEETVPGMSPANPQGSVAAWPTHSSSAHPSAVCDRSLSSRTAAGYPPGVPVEAVCRHEQSWDGDRPTPILSDNLRTRWSDRCKDVAQTISIYERRRPAPLGHGVSRVPVASPATGTLCRDEQHHQ
jgi:hypothetical protein